MTPAQIRRRRKTIEKQQIKWDAEEEKLKKLCSHPNADKKYCGSTGNYDRTMDCYWIEFKCPDCGKRWQRDQ